MKKTCYGCRALEKNTKEYYCVYRFKIETVCTNKNLGIINIKPMEDCPKPKTIKRYVECFKELSIFTKND